MSANSPLQWPYNILGLEELPSDQKDIKRAYAHKLKKIDQATQADKFQELREAYEAALARSAKPILKSITPVKPETKIGPVKKPREKTTQSPKEVDEFATDWGLVNSYCDEFSEMVAGKINLERVRQILRNPIFIDPHAMSQIEIHIFNGLNEKVSFTKKGAPYFKRQEVSAELLEFLDDKYKWLSDFVGFQQKFWHPDGFLAAATNLVAAAKQYQFPFKNWAVFKTKYTEVFTEPRIGALVAWLLALLHGIFAYSSTFDTIGLLYLFLLMPFLVFIYDAFDYYIGIARFSSLLLSRYVLVGWLVFILTCSSVVAVIHEPLSKFLLYYIGMGALLVYAVNIMLIILHMNIGSPVFKATNAIINALRWLYRYVKFRYF